VATEEVASTDEGTVEADTLAGDETEGQAEHSGDEPEPEAESASKTRE
jgi:hypothetical protein